MIPLTIEELFILVYSSEQTAIQGAFFESRYSCILEISSFLKQTINFYSARIYKSTECDKILYNFRKLLKKLEITSLDDKTFLFNFLKKVSSLSYSPFYKDDSSKSKQEKEACLYAYIQLNYPNLIQDTHD